jgi:Ni/Co efflux regulator RcnB
LGTFVLLAALAVGAAAQDERKKATSDDRSDPNASLAEVGKGTHMARQPLKPGAYFNDKARASVRAYYAAHPIKGAVPGNAWQIGQHVPAGAAAVPAALLAKLPKLPPGHKYVQLAGDVLLVAAGSGMVVDAIDAQAK